MGTKKVTVTLPDELVARAGELARQADLPFSTWLARAAEQRVRVEDGLAAMREWEAEAGPPSEQAVSWVDEQFARVGAERGSRYRTAS